MWLPVWWHARERHCPGTDPLWGGGPGIGGDTATICLACSFAVLSFLFFYNSVNNTNVTMYHHLISQAGWNGCNLSIYLSVYSAGGTMM